MLWWGCDVVAKGIKCPLKRKSTPLVNLRLEAVALALNLLEVLPMSHKSSTCGTVFLWLDLVFIVAIRVVVVSFANLAKRLSIFLRVMRESFHTATSDSIDDRYGYHLMQRIKQRSRRFFEFSYLS